MVLRLRSWSKYAVMVSSLRLRSCICSHGRITGVVLLRLHLYSCVCKHAQASIVNACNCSHESVSDVIVLSLQSWSCICSHGHLTAVMVPSLEATVVVMSVQTWSFGSYGPESVVMVLLLQSLSRVCTCSSKAYSYSPVSTVMILLLWS